MVLGVMAGVALLVLAGVLVASLTVTDTQRIRQTLVAAAAGLQANNAKLVYPCIVPDADGNRARELVVSALSQAEFQDLTIRNLDVKFNSRTSPPTATATFTVWVRGTDRSGTMGEVSRFVAMTVEFRKESGRWLVCGEPKHDVREVSLPGKPRSP
jgi:uncharacterized protein YchJ